MDSLVTFFTTNLSGILSKEAIVFLISLMPILELRGGLLAASLLNLPYLQALIICVIGNVLPIPFILLFINKVLDWMEIWKPTQKLARWLREKADKNKGQIETYGFWGLLLFVGIPLPGTGAWTGALVASLLHMKLKKSFPAIMLGVALAAAIMSIISYGVLGALIH